MFHLINQQPSSCEEAVRLLKNDSSPTEWSRITSAWAVSLVEKFTQEFGDRWSKGSLPEDFFFDILLPEHAHCFAKTEDVQTTFGDNTSLLEAVRLFVEHPDQFFLECVDHITHLQEKIRTHGFTSAVHLVIVDGKLKHVDGLHRLIALGSLVKSGYRYEPIPVLVCNFVSE